MTQIYRHFVRVPFGWPRLQPMKNAQEIPEEPKIGGSIGKLAPGRFVRINVTITIHICFQLVDPR